MQIVGYMNTNLAVVCVMDVKFAHGFILDRNLNIFLLSYPGRAQLITAAEVRNTYQFIILSQCLNPALT